MGSAGYNFEIIVINILIATIYNTFLSLLSVALMAKLSSRGSGIFFMIFGLYGSFAEGEGFERHIYFVSPFSAIVPYKFVSKNFFCEKKSIMSTTYR